MSGMMVGAGMITRYLISRYHDYLRRRIRLAAKKALTSIGTPPSAATVAITFKEVFTQLGILKWLVRCWESR